MKKKRLMTGLFAAAVAVSMALSGCQSTSQESQNTNNVQDEQSGEAVFASGSGTADDPWVIESAQQLNLMHEHLDGHYILGADIDLADFGGFEPIGVFEPLSEEEDETALPEAAFTGSFNGNGHKISNITIEAGEKSGVGLFGAVSGVGSGVTNLEVENITVDGGMYLGGVIGFADWDAKVDSITLSGDNNITGTFLVGGIVGAAHCPEITNCTAEANVVLNGDKAQGAGIIVGGAEQCNIVNCSAIGGSVTATGSASLSIGAMAGCAQESEYVENCMAENITVSAPADSYMIGGLLGHAGRSDGNMTEIKGCTVRNVAITADNSAERIGMIVGSGFYGAIYKEYYPEPLAFAVSNCTAEGSIDGGSIVGAAAGYTYNNSTVESCTASVLINGADSNILIGGTSETNSVDTLN